MVGFYGFGNYQAPYWFIGMEEGGNAEFQHIDKQIRLWDQWERKELLDVIEFAHKMDFHHLTKWYGDKAILQKTWKNLIRIFLTANKESADKESIRQYQKKFWGTKNNDTCLMELLPLPSPRRSLWRYKDFSTLSYLADRKTYEKYIVGSRIAHIQTRIKKFKPNVVVFYGKGFDDYWKKIVGINSWKLSSKNINYEMKDETLFIFSYHPQHHGIEDDYFYNIGNFIKEHNAK